MSHHQSNLDHADSQMGDFLEKHKGKKTDTTTTGVPIPYQDAPQTVGPKGPILLQDHIFLEQLSHFGRERIPERVVHAKGAGAFGYFEVTHDITKYTAAKIFSQIGKRTSMVVRFSQVGGGQDSADTVRDLRGFALKFFTEDGIWDLTGNNIPIFAIRDSMLFPSFIHVLKKNPVTNIRDWNMFWDFASLREETMHQTMMFFSDRGIPKSYRHMNGFGINTFSLINNEKKMWYCKFHYKTDQGFQTMDVKEAAKQVSNEPDYYIRDLYNHIAQRDFPSWNFYIQVMTPDQAKSSSFDPFDVTKVWPKGDYPLIPVGKFTLNRNPKNYFAEVEQLAFSPAHLVPGIQASPDRMLQGRLFAYVDTQLYRLGVNYNQLPVNSPYEESNYLRNGFMTLNNQGGSPNYHPNSFGGPEPDQRAKDLEVGAEVCGVVSRYDSGGDDEDNFAQPRKLYHDVMKEDERLRMVDNIAATLKNTFDFVQKRVVAMFSKVDEELGKRIEMKLKASKKTQAML